ncbi:MAG TPA: hypothetical protein VGQ73_00030 [Gemmatimonadales bacterium]|jgi:hypothetical protein|nr:hypothetical protein [Gemmatimonadales bacterium]
MRDSKTVIRWLGAMLVALVLLVLAAHLILERRFNTEHVQQRLAATVARHSDSLYLIRIGSAHFSLLGRSLLISGLELSPDTAAFARRGKLAPVSGTRFLVTAASLHVTGIDLWRFLRNQVWVHSAELDSMRAEVLVDRTRPRRPEHPVRLPHQVLQAAGLLRIDRFQIAHSQIRFSERASDGARYGTLRFDSLDVAASNLTDDPLRMSVATPCEIEVRALLEGVGPTAVRFDYDLVAPRLNLLFHGSVSRFGGRALNDILVDYEGFRIRSGELDSLWFDVTVRDDTATGKLKLLYHDLEIETLDKVSRERDLGDLLRTFIFNHFKLQSENPSSGAPPRVIALWHQRRPEDGFFRTFWRTLRAGIFQTLGIAASPRSSTS